MCNVVERVDDWLNSAYLWVTEHTLHSLALAFLLGCLVTASCEPAFAEEPHAKALPLPYEVDSLPANALEVYRVKIHDADTIRGDVVLPFGVGLFNQSIRLNDCDIWEVDKTRSQVEPFKSFTAKQWEVEIARGVKARDELKKLAEGGRWHVVPSKDGKSVYSRLEADFYVATGSGKIIDVKKWANWGGHERQHPALDLHGGVFVDPAHAEFVK